MAELWRNRPFSMAECIVFMPEMTAPRNRTIFISHYGFHNCSRTTIQENIIILQGASAVWCQLIAQRPGEPQPKPGYWPACCMRGEVKIREEPRPI